MIEEAKKSAWALVRPGRTLGVTFAAAVLLAAVPIPIASRYDTSVEGGTAAEAFFLSRVLEQLSSGDELVALVQKPDYQRNTDRWKVTMMSPGEAARFMADRKRDDPAAIIARAMETAETFTRAQAEAELQKVRHQANVDSERFRLSLILAIGGLALAVFVAASRPGLQSREATALSSASTRNVRLALGVAVLLMALLVYWWLPLLGPDLMSTVTHRWEPPIEPFALQLVGVLSLVIGAVRTFIAKPQGAAS